MEEKKMTKLEYEAALAAWGENAKLKMKAILGSKTHGTGALAKSIKVSVKENTKTTSHAVGFNFHRYGAFLAYGVGRGWHRTTEGGTAKTVNVAKGSILETMLKKRGYTKKEINQYFIATSYDKPRKPLDWFDTVIRQGVESLSDIVIEYYGDYAMSDLLEVIRKATITKAYN